MAKKILVLGGQGYIGSQTVLSLLDNGFEVVSLDKVKSDYLKEGFENVDFEQADLQDKASLEKVFSKYDFDGVIHFAASIEVGESQLNPEKYYLNNVAGTLNLLSVMREYDVNNIVFSSTAAVYGIPKQVPILEESIKEPINTYGRTKLMMEQILTDYSTSYGLNQICLRYFNACGADLQQRAGEAHEPESHLIPIVLQVANGDREFLQVNGQDYNTPDGTCVRDFIHTLDLASAHVLALKKVLEATTTVSQSINLGTKNGYSITQVIEATKKVTGKDIPLKYGPRRSGDPDQLIADNTKAFEYLGWKPQHSDLETILDSAWKWYQSKGRDIQAKKAKLALEEMV